MPRYSNNTRGFRASAITVAALGALSGASIASAQPLLYPDEESVLEEEVEMLKRYAVELIVFEYSSTVASGTELFLPEVIEIEPLPEDELAGEGYVLDADGQLVAPVDEELAEETTAAAEDLSDDVPEFSDVSDEEIDPWAHIDPNTPLEEIIGYDSIRFSLLDPESLTMTEMYERLASLSAYRPLLHSGWVQAAFDEEMTPPIRLRTLGVIPIRFGGEFTLYLGRYLHLVVDLSMTEQPEEQFTAEATSDSRYPDDSWTGFGYDEEYDQGTGPIIYRLNENRIVADGDLRYFDHPRFGVLARITRMEDIPAEREDPPEDEFGVLEEFTGQ